MCFVIIVRNEMKEGTGIGRSLICEDFKYSFTHGQALNSMFDNIF